MKLNSIDDLTPADYNPRDITNAASDGLAESIQRFGDVAGITFNARTKRLVCGHQRVAQLRKLGAQLVRGALQLANGERFPVRIVDWSEAEEKAANVTANNKHIAGTFTAELDSLLDEIQGSIGEGDFIDLRLDALLHDTSRALGKSDEDYSPPDESEVGMPDRSEFNHECPRCGHRF